MRDVKKKIPNEKTIDKSSLLVLNYFPFVVPFMVVHSRKFSCRDVKNGNE